MARDPASVAAPDSPAGSANPGATATSASAARFWRLSWPSADAAGRIWDMERLAFELPTGVSVVDRFASGSASEKLGPANAFRKDTSIWGGRARPGGDCGSELFIGVELNEPAVPRSITMVSGPSPHRPSRVLVECSDNGADWRTCATACTATNRRRHVVFYAGDFAASDEVESASRWRLVAPDGGRFAWDVRRLRPLFHGSEVAGEWSSSGDAGETWCAENVAVDDGSIWGGRADDAGRFHLTLAVESPVALDRLVLDQGEQHWLAAVAVERCSTDGEWQLVKRFDRLGPGHNDLFLLHEPPVVLPALGELGAGDRVAGFGRAPDRPVPLRDPEPPIDRFADRRVLVLIAAYRDRDLPNTIRSALTQAAYPEHLRFAICHQHDAATVDQLDEWSDDPRFHVDAVPFDQSQGCCWARSRTFERFDDEPYILQIDAHTRFAARWDVRYIEMLESIDSELPLLTSYPPSFRLGADDAGESNAEITYDLNSGLQRLVIVKVRPDLTTLQQTELVDDASRPGWSPSIAAGQIFTRGRFCRDVPYDPNVYFAGEEISLAARAFTAGYDLVHPSENLIWHLYDHAEPKHWEDHGDHSESHRSAVERLRTLFQGDADALGRYGLGRARSLAEFEAHAGVSLRDPGADPPPPPAAESRPRRAASLVDEPAVDQSTAEPPGPSNGECTVRIHTERIEPRDDYDHVAVIFFDAAGDQVARTELRRADVLDLSRSRVTLRQIDASRAHDYVVVPVRADGVLGVAARHRLGDTDRT